MSEEPLSEARIEALTIKIMEAVRNSYADPPAQPGEPRVLEALNAIAVAVAVVLEGAPEGLWFFQRALQQQIDLDLLGQSRERKH